jgi:hypothetical protein
MTPETVLKVAEKRGQVKTEDVARHFDVSRQFAHRILSLLVRQQALIKIGRTRGVHYVTADFARTHPETVPNRVEFRLQNEGLEEHVVLDRVEQALRGFDALPENVQSIFRYAFSEMLNNAIEHSESNRIHVTVSLDDQLIFAIEDFGIGVFRSVQQKRSLASPLEAIQDLLKGKTTTMPASHSGEGIFFTSKAGDRFGLVSFRYELIVDQTIPDVFVSSTAPRKRGTRVSFVLSTRSTRHLKAVFDEYANLVEGEYGFDKTEILVRLYTLGGVHISRSQARRILACLDKFTSITFDFDRVPVIGQAFADEIYRVFARQHPDIELHETHMNAAVRFMIERARTEARRYRAE